MNCFVFELLMNQAINNRKQITILHVGYLIAVINECVLKCLWKYFMTINGYIQVWYYLCLESSAEYGDSMDNYHYYYFISEVVLYVNLCMILWRSMWIN